MSWDGVAGLIAAIVTFGWSLTWSQETPPEPPPSPAPATVQRPQLDQAILESLMAAIAKCWHLPMAPGHEGVRVRIYAELDRSGRVLSTKALAPEGPDLSAEALASIAAAEGALKRCQPYDLPEPLYDSWRTIIVNFAPGPPPTP
jgi:hypothetical protein